MKTLIADRLSRTIRPLGAIAWLYAGIAVLSLPSVGHAVPRALLPGWSVRQIPGEFHGIGMGLAYDPVSDSLLATDYFNEPIGTQAVNRITLTGQESTLFSIYPQYPENFLDIARNPLTGNLYVLRHPSNDPDGLFVLDANGNLLDQRLFPMYLDAFEVGLDGSLYATSTFPSNGLIRYDEQNFSWTMVVKATGTFGDDLTSDPNGNFYASTGNLLKISPSGVVTTLASGFGGYIAYGDGFIYGSFQDRHINRIAADGTGFVRFATGHTHLSGSLHYGSNGRLYVIDNDQIWEYSFIPEPKGILAGFVAFLGALRKRAAIRHSFAGSRTQVSSGR